MKGGDRSADITTLCSHLLTRCLIVESAFIFIFWTRRIDSAYSRSANMAVFCIMAKCKQGSNSNYCNTEFVFIDESNYYPLVVCSTPRKD